ncbi:hypothetical protein PoB_002299400 [Plakobranchus ocellatus]|uniref:Uncharacterized protein n=1 Tax=Plakobranchus ocellatus TaxID=259542 RepID=A0AAV3ZRJ7_9GAST|nr:hypothetical protein PoB_002299400 [Plakobranchus ocellatus]
MTDKFFRSEDRGHELHVFLERNVLISCFQFKARYLSGRLSTTSELSAQNAAIEIPWPEKSKVSRDVYVATLKRQLSHETARAFLPLYSGPAHPSLTDLTGNKLCKKLMALRVKVLAK